MLRSLVDLYPSTIWQLGSELYLGLAVLSSLPARRQQDLQLVTGKSYQLVLELDGGASGPISVVGLHAHAPRSDFGFRRRNDLLELSAKAINDLRGPKIVLADLNTPMWSSYFRSYLETAGLQDARAGFGLQSTFSLFPGWPGFAPLDHILPSAQFVVKSLRTGPNVSSDHLPLIAELELKRP